MGRLEAAVAAPDEVVRVSPGSKEAAGAARQAQAVASARSRGNALFTDRVGQRPLLLVSTGGMTVSLLVLGSVFAAFAGAKDDAVVAAVAVAALVAFVCTFSVGLGPLAWVYSSEILLLRLRGQGAGLGTAMNRVMSGIVTMTFISLYGAITMAGTFYLYTAVAAASFVFIYACLPETRGRNLEDIEQLFRTK